MSIPYNRRLSRLTKMFVLEINGECGNILNATSSLTALDAALTWHRDIIHLSFRPLESSTFSKLPASAYFKLEQNRQIEISVLPALMQSHTIDRRLSTHSSQRTSSGAAVPNT
jgi:hypothetical protein